MSTAVDTDDARERRVALLAELFHHRWLVPVLAELSSSPAHRRVAPLLARLGVSRPSLRRTLDALFAAGLARRNPGYGHPLRPEIDVLPRGAALGPWCVKTVAAAESVGAGDVVRRKWSLAVLLLLGDGVERFSELESAAPGLTARALAQALARLEEASLVERLVYDDRPPSVRYRPTKAGKRLAARAAALPLK